MTKPTSNCNNKRNYFIVQFLQFNNKNKKISFLENPILPNNFLIIDFPSERKKKKRFCVYIVRRSISRSCCELFLFFLKHSEKSYVKEEFHPKNYVFFVFWLAKKMSNFFSQHRHNEICLNF